MTSYPPYLYTLMIGLENGLEKKENNIGFYFGKM